MPYVMYMLISYFIVHLEEGKIEDSRVTNTSILQIALSLPNFQRIKSSSFSVKY